MIEIQVGTNDLARMRFTTDAVWETTASLNAIAFPHAHLLHERLRHRLPCRPTFDMEHLRVLTANRSWIPDALGPTPSSRPADPEHQFAALEDVAPSVAAGDLDRLRKLYPKARTAAMSPAEYLATTARAMTGYWRAVLHPLWERIQAIAEADIAHHRQALASNGLREAIPNLHDELSFAGRSVCVAMPSNTRVRASGQGLWFVPSVFRWPWLALDLREAEPVISYAALGAGRVWESPDRPEVGLIELLGKSRAALLQRLEVSHTTTALATALGLFPSTVSWHLSVMTASGLLTSRREGRRVLYTRTLVGDLLAQGSSALAHIG